MDKKEMRRAYLARAREGGVYLIRNRENGRALLMSAADMETAKNRFAFMQATNTSPSMKMAEEWKRCGKDAFSLEILETISKKEEQTDREFADDIAVLLELWREKLGKDGLY